MAKKNKFYDKNKSHHTEYGFQNNEPINFSQKQFYRWQKERILNKLPKPPKQGYKQFAQAWQTPINLTLSGNNVWWIGHSTLLLHLQNQWILTDPVFSNRVSPFAFIGPKRFIPPAITIAQLPKIDSVIISHAHYDHLDKTSVLQLVKHNPRVIFFVPLGLKRWFYNLGIKRVYELDWWQQHEIKNIVYTAVPAKHWSARGLFDRDRALWCGWVLSSQGGNFYFAGDTGYSHRLIEIKERLAPIDLAALPIGAYEPRWFMRSQHIDPREAVQIHCELNCKRSLAIHWGTFELTDESIDTPMYALQSILQEKRINESVFCILKVGESLSF